MSTLCVCVTVGVYVWIVYTHVVMCVCVCVYSVHVCSIVCVCVCVCTCAKLDGHPSRADLQRQQLPMAWSNNCECVCTLLHFRNICFDYKVIKLL